MSLVLWALGTGSIIETTAYGFIRRAQPLAEPLRRHHLEEQHGDSGAFADDINLQ